MKEKINKLSLPATILVASIILGGFYYASQANKQRSIERQQLSEQLEERAQKEIENKRAELKLKQEECESLSDGVRDRWSNVVGVTYDEIWMDCVVTYTDTETGKIEVSLLKLMQDVK